MTLGELRSALDALILAHGPDIPVIDAVAAADVLSVGVCRDVAVEGPGGVRREPVVAVVDITG